MTEPCSNCETDVSLLNTTGKYSLLPDGTDPYDNSTVKSNILTNNAVYTLDTTGTLVSRLVDVGTRTVGMHFYSKVENSAQFPNNVLPPCWQGQHEQDQAVNWSVFASNSVNFPQMTVGVFYSGFARMDFNVRNGSCDNQVFRFYLRWYNVCITRTSDSPKNTWVVTSDACEKAINYGEANLKGQGGKKQTFDYGDWRMPFELTLVQE